MNAHELAALDIDNLTCDTPTLVSAENGLKEWKDALTLMQTGALEKDVKELKEILMLA
jgi:hypothetical protein